MSLSIGRDRAALYALFLLSGFAGLIYESIWSHYLKLFLGHAAYAQTLVLSIFMGGMALGAWLAGGFSQKVRSPLRWYAAVECLLGLAALGFDPLFRGMQAFVFDSVIPALDAPATIELTKWGLSAGIILPQSILLGATFPLMSAGIVRLYPSIPGGALSWLYFTNSLGASVGVLASGFLLVDRFGLPGTLLCAALINFLLAISVYLLARRVPDAPAPTSSPSGQGPAIGALARLMLATALLTGAASFLYEIGWIRMLSLVLGSATHSFELMLSAFIFGLAAGSFWIRNRIDRLQNPLRMLGWIQVTMAAFALLSLPLYMQLFEAMASFWTTVQSNDGGYTLFTLFSYSLCFLLMLPATFCAGMTLPLITSILLRSEGGEAAIGRVYAANTVGAILGILFAVHVVMPNFGLRQVVIAGVLVDFLLGMFLLARSGMVWGPPQRAAFAAFVVLATFILVAVRFDPHITGSGVYRVGKAQVEGEILFHADGKTASVDVSRYADGTVSIATNGKVDAGLNLQGVVGADDYTMIMLALLPLAAHPQAQTAAVIGMGSGTSSHMLLHDPQLVRVDTIEIEPAMVEGARHFGKAVHKVYDDPRSHLRIEDAKTYFARAGQRYDLILSEPSNPWVSGIASLFSLEFYDQVKRYLNRDGLFVQWLHLYEINQPLISTVMNALSASFEDYVVYANNGDDIMIVARADGKVPELNGRLFSDPAFAEPLQRLSMKDIADLEVRRLGGKAVLEPYFRSFGMPANSDYYPVLDQNSARQRFLIADARGFLQIHSYALRLERRLPVVERPLSPPTFYQPVPGMALRAQEFARRVLGRESSAPGLLTAEQESAAGVLRLLEARCGASDTAALWLPALRRLTMEAAPYLTPALGKPVSERLRRSACLQSADESARSWLSLFEAIATGQPARVAEAARPLLPAATSDLPVAQFLIAEWVLADLLTGGPQQAAATLTGVSGLPDSPALQLLRAQALVAAPASHPQVRP